MYSHEIVSACPVSPPAASSPTLACLCFQALRLLLASASGIAARYGRYIVPVLSLSIDFYMRVFFRIYTSPLQVKQAFRFVSSSSSSCRRWFFALTLRPAVLLQQNRHRLHL